MTRAAPVLDASHRRHADAPPLVPELPGEPLPGPRLRIVHCFRSPVGGIFRHVRDLVDEQVADGHSIGIVCDANTGGAFEDGFFRTLAPRLALGLHRIPMQRAVGPGDALALWRAFGALRRQRPDVLHSHGAKGGAYARLIGSMLRRSGIDLVRLYCPHGGSMHYDAGSLGGQVYFALERALERMTDRMVFVSAYERDAYRGKVGRPVCAVDLVPNGLAPEEFEPVRLAPDAADYLYIGMMRDLKGTDLFVRALAAIDGATGVAVGDGPDRGRYERLARELGLGERLRFLDPMPARDAFALARTVVVPSRAESMPYIVLEAIAAARPVIATRVGGVPEIFAGHTDLLVEPDDLAALEAAMRVGTVLPLTLRESVELRHSRAAMAQSVMSAYRAAIAERDAPGQRPAAALEGAR